MQIKRYNIVLALLLSIFLSSCIEEYRAPLDKYDVLFVVDGSITNEPGPYTVKLSISKEVYYSGLRPFPGAQVVISDNEGNAEILTEFSPGIYKTAPSGIQGIVGREYKITIRTPAGSIYESEYERLLQPTAIDSVYGELEYRLDKDYEFELGGYQFYLDAYPSEEEAKHFLWNLQATYKYHSDFYIDYMYNGSLNPFPSSALYNCWKTKNISKIFTFDLQNLSVPEINRFQLHYVNTKSRELSVRYSLLAKQYSISEKAYLFWNNLKNQEDQQGALYTSQPFQIKGNIKNREYPEELVLGYFMVAGVSQKRLFVNRPPSVPFQYSRCYLTETDFQAYEVLEWTDPSMWPLYITSFDNQLAVPNQACLDCRLRGGTTEKPEFWID